MEALLDGGASHCHLPASSIPLLQSKGVKIQPVAQDVLMGDGRPSTVSGKALIPVNLGDKTWVGEFYFLESLPYEAILGIDCLRGFRMIIDFDIPKVTLRDRPSVEVPLIHLCCSETRSATGLDPTNLSSAESDEWNVFLAGWQKKFADSPGRTDVLSHEIFLEPGTAPVKQRNYPCSPAISAIISAEIDDLLEKQLIEPSISPWSSPLVVVPKKNGEKRVCVDFRALNARTVKNSYSLPYLQEVLDSLKDSCLVSTIDLKSGFHQVPLAPGSRPLTAFSVPGGRGLYQSA